jgi:multisubunit Na+/H+ antiporter MnhE subunit
VTLGTSLVIVAVGAILRYAVTDSLSWIDLQTVGLILMIVGIIGAIVSVVWMIMSSRRPPRPGAPSDGRDVYY